MKRLIISIISFVFIMNLTLFSNPDKNNKAKYKQYKQDAVLKQIKEKRDEIQKKKDEITKKIKEKQKKDKKLKRKERKTLTTDTYGVFPPKSKESFKSSNLLFRI
jgi:peptidoglycan hydrolase CwlO-like protein